MTLEQRLGKKCKSEKKPPVSLEWRGKIAGNEVTGTVGCQTT